MKRLAIVLSTLIGPFFIGSCQERLDLEIQIDLVSGKTESVEEDKQNLPGFEDILSLEGHLSPHQQGGDCWGDYFFQFVTNNSVVRIYDLATKTLVQTLTIPGSQRGFVSTCHCNTVCFGTEYFDPEDIFPLLYVSTGYAAEGYTGVLVYRITQHQGVFFITHVQTIRFPADESSWTEFIPADEYAYICYSTTMITKVKMPKLKDGDTVIEIENAIETIHFPPYPEWMFSSRHQDRIFYQGKILLISGVPQSGEASAFIVLNPETKERESIIDFKKNGLYSESESIFIWRGDLCVAFVDRIVKLVNFINTP